MFELFIAVIVTAVVTNPVVFYLGRLHERRELTRMLEEAQTELAAELEEVFDNGF